MTKWECMRKISEYGVKTGKDTVLALLEWCNKQSTAAVSQEEAEAFLKLLVCRQ